MKEEMNCKDCLYYKDWTKPLLKQPIGKNKSVKMETETLCKAHEKRYTSDSQWHPVNNHCFTIKE